MKKVFGIILLFLTLFSCTKNDEDVDIYNYAPEVVAVFTPNKIGDHTDAGLIYQGIVRATDSLGLSFRSIFPATYEDGAETLAQLVGSNQQGRKRLIVATDPEYSDFLRNLASAGNIIDSDSTKLLVLDGGFNHPNVYSVHVPFYGMMYKAGYLASQMHDVDSVRIYLANDKYLYMREARDGFIDGFTQERENTIDVVDFSESTLSDTEGFQCRTEAYLYYAPECYPHFDMILPVCGETSMGFIRYNRDFPGCFYTVGVETDMSIYTSYVPFSCVEHIDRVLVACISDWKNEQLEHHRNFGMEGGWTELVVSDEYKDLLESVSQEIHQQAIEKEANYDK